MTLLGYRFYTKVPNITFHFLFPAAIFHCSFNQKWKNYFASVFKHYFASSTGSCASSSAWHDDSLPLGGLYEQINPSYFVVVPCSRSLLFGLPAPLSCLRGMVEAICTARKDLRRSVWKMLRCFLRPELSVRPRELCVWMYNTSCYTAAQEQFLWTVYCTSFLPLCCLYIPWSLLTQVVFTKPF